MATKSHLSAVGRLGAVTPFVLSVPEEFRCTTRKAGSSREADLPARQETLGRPDSLVRSRQPRTGKEPILWFCARSAFISSSSQFLAQGAIEIGWFVNSEEASYVRAELHSDALPIR